MLTINVPQVTFYYLLKYPLFGSKQANSAYQASSIVQKSYNELLKVPHDLTELSYRNVPEATKSVPEATLLYEPLKNKP